MEMKFNSQICTTREQSERLLALGLKKETADCCYYYYDGEYLIAFAEDANYPSDIPAWSLHRLLSLIPSSVSEFNIEMDGVYSIGYTNLIIFCKGYLYDNIIDCIEWLIKEGYFNKEYLCEK